MFLTGAISVRVMCLFSGQGSQQSDFFSNFKSSSWEALAIEGEYDLSQWCQKHAGSSTDIQAHIVGISRWLWARLEPFLEKHEVCLGGHSLGELTATSVNLGWGLLETLELAQCRENLMKRASPLNSEVLALLGPLDRKKLADYCNPVNGPWLMNDNGPEQVIIGGPCGLMDRVHMLKEILGFKRALKIPMTMLSHCPALESMTASFQKAVELVPSPPLGRYEQRICRNGKSLNNSIDLKENLVLQLTQCVHFREMIETVEPDLFLEIGPRTILTGLIQKMTSIPCLALNSAEKLEEARVFLEKGCSNDTME